MNNELVTAAGLEEHIVKNRSRRTVNRLGKPQLFACILEWGINAYVSIKVSSGHSYGLWPAMKIRCLSFSGKWYRKAKFQVHRD